MSQLRKYLPYIILALFFIGIVLVEIYKPKPIDWTPTFSKEDKIPYGNYVLYDRMQDVFPNSEIEDVGTPIYNHLKSEEWEKTNYVFINDQYTISTLDYQFLLDYVEAGNNAFIVAGRFNFGDLKNDTLAIDTRYSSFNNFFGGTEDSNTITIDVWDDGMDDFNGVNFVHCGLYHEEGYTFKRKSGSHYFTQFDTSRVQILGADKTGKANFIKLEYGEGAFYLNSIPFAFTNYNILDKETNGAEYVSLALSHLPNQTIFWDEYYKIGNDPTQSKSEFRYFLSNEALRWLLYMSLVALVLFMIFEAKRKQRIIPIVEPPSNTTMEFVETVSSLYLNKGDHKNLADKKIQYFYDFLRNKLYISDIQFSEDFYTHLSSKSGVDFDEVKKLFTVIYNIKNKKELFEDELLLLNRRIDEFYEKTGIVVG